jgi:hypothetical protein
LLLGVSDVCGPIADIVELAKTRVTRQFTADE